MLAPLYDILPPPEETGFWKDFGYVTGIDRDDFSSLVGLHLVGRVPLWRDMVGDYFSEALIKQVAVDLTNNHVGQDLSKKLPHRGLSLACPTTLGPDEWLYFEPVEDPAFWYYLSNVLAIDDTGLAAGVGLRMAAKDRIIADRVGTYFIFAMIDNMVEELKPVPKPHPIGRRGLHIVGKPSPEC